VSSYQTFDKWLDQFYMACFLIVVLRWPDPARAIAVGLYGVRMVGFAAFEVTGAREVLVAFPNLFEFWFLFVAYLSPASRPAGQDSAALGQRTLLGRPFAFTTGNVAAALLVLLAMKETQELAIHWFKVFDSFTAVEAVQGVWDWLTGPLK
jgi:hypothetical protein